MKCPHCEKEIPLYKNPVPTVDIIIEIEGKFVLIERKNPPFGWALPGGFVDYGESYEDAAEREALEETGLQVSNIQQFRTYSNPNRDPRMHTASTVFSATATGIPQAGDDAADVQLFDKKKLPNLAFDHSQILADFLKQRAKQKCSLFKIPS